MKFFTPTKFLTLFVFALCLFTMSVVAQDYDLDTSLNNYYPIPSLNKPGYLQTVTDPLFNTKITRITGDVGTAVPNISGENWRNIARHGYSARQPWNADESIIYLGKHKSSSGGWGSSLFLNGETYEVIKKANNIPSANEQRWHPTNPDLMMLLRDDGVYTWSYSTGTTTQLFSLSGYSNTSTGNTGNYSNNGNKAGIYARRNSDGKTVAFAIDMENNIKHNDIDMTGVDIDYVSISPLGNYVLVNAVFDGHNDSTKIFDLNGNQVGPHWAEYGRPSHYDMAVGKDGIEYVVGNSKSSPDEGRIIKRRLTDGAVTVLSQGGYGSHASARSLNRVGWIFTSMSDSQNWGPYYNELVAVNMEESRVERIASIRSNFETYDNETQACPSPSGGRVLYASDWGSGTYPIQCYIADFRDKIQGGGGSVVNAGLDQNICQDDDVTLTATGAVSYVWDTGATTASITVNPSATTTHTVTGTQSNGDTSTDSIIVTVNSIPVANAGADASICEDEDVVLTASGGSSYLWSNGSTTQSTTVSPGSTTSYSVIVTQNSCSSADEVTVTVKPRQTINAGNDVDINLGESTTLTVVGEGEILWNTGETTASITVSPTVNTTYTVEVTEQNGCTSYDEVTITIAGNINANAGEDASICLGEETILTASGGPDYLWSTGETTASITVNPSSTTNYTVIVSNSSTSDTDDVTVYVNEVPTVEASDDVTIDVGNYVTISATGADTYLWSNGATQPNIAVSPQNTTTYHVTGYTNNCSDEAEVTVNVENSINANAGKDMLICSGDDLTLTASGGGTNYLWSTGETSQSIDVNPIEDTIYTVTISNDFASDNDDVAVFVENCGEEEESSNYQYDIYPNPTKGGMLQIQFSGLAEISKLYIHDAVGKLMYTEDISDNAGLVMQKHINISKYSIGLYFVTLEETTKTTTKKIIFQ